MKTIVEYEASDINIGENKLHGILSVGILVSSLIMAPKNIDPTIDKEGHNKAMKDGVATFLNILSKSGYTISMIEDVPEVFRTA